MSTTVVLLVQNPHSLAGTEWFVLRTLDDEIKRLSRSTKFMVVDFDASGPDRLTESIAQWYLGLDDSSMAQFQEQPRPVGLNIPLEDHRVITVFARVDRRV